MLCGLLSPVRCYFRLSSPQDVVLMRALRDMNLPKFVFEDVPLFLGLISDLFPGLDCPRVRYPNFNDAVEQILQENKYVMLPNQVSHLGLRFDSFKYKLSYKTLRLLSFSGKDLVSACEMLIYPTSYAACGFRWIKWCRCMRR